MYQGVSGLPVIVLFGGNFSGSAVGQIFLVFFPSRDPNPLCSPLTSMPHGGMVNVTWAVL